MTVRTVISDDAENDRRRTCAGDNAAYIADNVATNTADLLGILDETDRYTAPRHLFRSHRSKRFDVAIRRSNADTVKNDADEDKKNADQQGDDQIALTRNDFGRKTEKRRKNERDDRHFQRPKIALLSLAFRVIPLRLFFLGQRLRMFCVVFQALTPYEIGGGNTSKPCAIGPVGFPLAERAVTERAVSF